MTVVVDANLLVVLALNDERAPLVDAKMRQWATAGETMHAPALMPYPTALAHPRVLHGLEPRDHRRELAGELTRIL